MKTINKTVPQSPRLVFRTAEPADAPAIVALVNSAYRGESSRTGWTTEADLLDGQRTDIDEISDILADPDSAIMLCHAGSELVSSAHLQKHDGKAYFGMFAVKPEIQNSGIGKRFLNAAEAFVHSAWQCRSMIMTVITLRQPLIAFYERRGYRRTGQLKPFPSLEKFGIPKVDGLQLEVLEKALINCD